jgi:hypothetical protein
LRAHRRRRQRLRRLGHRRRAAAAAARCGVERAAPRARDGRGAARGAAAAAAAAEAAAAAAAAAAADTGGGGGSTMAALGAHHMMAEHREWLRMHAHKAANAVQACAVGKATGAPSLEASSDGWHVDRLLSTALVLKERERPSRRPQSAARCRAARPSSVLCSTSTASRWSATAAAGSGAGSAHGPSPQLRRCHLRHSLGGVHGVGPGRPSSNVLSCHFKKVYLVWRG